MDEQPLHHLDGNGTPQDPYQISNATELQAIQEDLEAHYVLVDDVDASDTENWNDGGGFEPIGSRDKAFAGTLDGQNHTIRGLTIDRPSTRVVGLFAASEGTVKNIDLASAEVTGSDATAALISSNRGDVRRVTATGSVAGENSVGGLVAHNDGGTIEMVTAEVRVNGDYDTGGVVGLNEGRIERAVAVGSVESDRNAGGLLGHENGGEVRAVYSSASVSGSEFVGGLVGFVDTHTIQEGYAAGSVSGDTNVGGLAGSGSASNLDDLYWDVDATGQDEAVGDGAGNEGGLTTADLSGQTARSTLQGFDFDETWQVTDEYPVLRHAVENVSLSLAADEIAVGNETNASVAVDLTDGRTVAATETADYATNASNAAVNGGTVTTDDAGGVEITATVADESDTATLAVLTPPDVSFVDASLPAGGVPEGSPAVAEATLANDGGMPGTHAVNITVDGEHVATETVRVEGHSEQSIPVTWTPDAAGSYNLTVEGVDVGTVTTVDADAVSVGDAQVAEYVASDEPFEVSVDLENTADVPVALPATYTVGGETVAERAFVAETGTSTVTFEHAVTGEPGDPVKHDFSVGDETLTAASEIGSPAEFSITEVSVPDDAAADETVTITATVENVGDLAGTESVTLSFAGDAVTTEEISLHGGDSAEVTADVSPETTGSVDVGARVGGDEQSTSVTVDEAVTVTDGEGTGDGGDGGNGASGGDGTAEPTAEDGPGFGVELALAALLGVGLVARRR